MTAPHPLVATILALLCAKAIAASPDLVVADFEGPDYGNWSPTGTAFGSGPAQGTLPNQMTVDGYQGHGLVNSFYGGDASVGTLTSPDFRIERHYMHFLVGGGQHPGETCMNLLLNEQVVRTVTGPNDRPGGAEHLDWQQWDVSEFRGKLVRLQIVDNATGGWGHINIDQIIQTDRRLPGILTNATRQLTVSQRYLNFPVKNGAPKRLVRITVDEQPVREFEIELADREPDFWVFTDLTPFHGKRATVQVDRIPEDSTALSSMKQSAEFKGAENLYQEELRPQFHFTSRRGWNNDPNGLVYFDGEYHLFYQHNPYGWNWGNMHWGHAVSRDLVHWEELGEALYPDALGTMFSGSAVVDQGNTSGLGPTGSKPLICMYTAAGGTSPASKGQRFTQALAYSTDRGRTWTKYAQNPVLPHIIAENRDPKAFWYEPQKKWVMALYLDKNDFALFSSPDLKQWERLSDVALPGTSECPEFFEIPVQGDSASTRWVFYGGNGRYLIGSFDGRKFTPESGPHALSFGNCFYASQTYNHIPREDGRRIMVGWGTVNLPGMPFNQMMDFPVELTLRKTAEGLRLFTLPVKEIERLRQSRIQLRDQALETSRPVPALSGECFDIAAEFEVGDAAELGIKARGVSITYSAKKHELACLDKTAPLQAIDGKIRLRLLVDRASIEIYANDGAIYMPMGTVLAKRNEGVEVFARGGKGRVVTFTGYTLNSAWPASTAAASAR